MYIKGNGPFSSGPRLTQDDENLVWMTNIGHADIIGVEHLVYGVNTRSFGSRIRRAIYWMKIRNDKRSKA